MRKYFGLFLAFALIGCAGEKEVPLKDKSADKLYAEGVNMLHHGDFADAADRFNEVEALFPYSAKAPISQILAAYSHFRAESYLDATRELDIFMRYHSSHKLMPYALYLRAMCIYMQVASVGRDAKIAQDAKDAFGELINRYPDSVYVQDSERKIFVLDNIIAAHEMQIGRFYQKKSNSLSALGRYTFVMKNYNHTTQAPEACYRIIECCQNEGLDAEAKSTYTFLTSKFPKSEWKAKADALMAIEGQKNAN